MDFPGHQLAHQSAKRDPAVHHRDMQPLGPAAPDHRQPVARHRPHGQRDLVPMQRDTGQPMRQPRHRIRPQRIGGRFQRLAVIALMPGGRRRDDPPGPILAELQVR